MLALEAYFLMATHFRLFCFCLLLSSLGGRPLIAQNYTPDQSQARAVAPPGLRAVVVGAEPQVRQPLSMSFDNKGRLWVLQYLQYPYPEGLKPVSRDQYLRTIWDKKPQPPPKGPKGADKITILEDPGPDGRFRKSKDVITGLNLATGFAIGNGGIYVLQAPYLLFYPDKNGDDVADGDPEMLVDGFGMEDSHAHGNSLIWGPDGWLYGAQGSTVTAKIRGLTFQQGIWRFHPVSKKFELFSEGGGNTWGLDFSPEGEVLAGTNWGGFALLHQYQGAYHIKGFAKHGPLQNPHSYGYFDHVPYQSFQGGHVTCGGVFHQGQALGPQFDKTYIAGNLLSSVVNWHKLEPNGSTYKASHGGAFLNPRDPWFRPVDLFDGPDGAIYVADWHDHRATHLDPIDTWDKRNGRIFKIEAKTAIPLAPFDTQKLSSEELIALLDHPEVWWQREALRLLYERKDATTAGGLISSLDTPNTLNPVRKLWALNASGLLKEELLVKYLAHADWAVRMWSIRFLGDPLTLGPDAQLALEGLAQTEENLRVLAQLACSTRRWPAKAALGIIKTLCLRTEAAKDVFLPLLIWWAIETHAVKGQATIASWINDPVWVNSRLVQATLIERLARRFMASDIKNGTKVVANLLKKGGKPALSGLEKSLEGQFLEKMPDPLKAWLDDKRASDTVSVQWISIGTRLGDEDSWFHALALATGTKTEAKERVALIKLLAQSGKPDAGEALLDVVKNSNQAEVQIAALDGLAGFANPAIGPTVIKRFPKLPKGTTNAALNLLASRPATAKLLLDSEETGALGKELVTLELARKMSGHKDPELLKRLEKKWGKLSPATDGEKQARMSYIQLIIGRAGSADPAKGKPIYEQKCATCHQLFGKGQKVGPDLTSAERQTLAPLVGHIVDPSANIRPEFRAFIVTTKDGRFLTGLVAEETAGAVTLIDVKGERIVVPRAQIEEMNASPASLMPEKALDGLSDQEIIDFFAYLRLREPPK